MFFNFLIVFIFIVSLCALYAFCESDDAVVSISAMAFAVCMAEGGGGRQAVKESIALCWFSDAANESTAVCCGVCVCACVCSSPEQPCLTGRQ